MTNRYPADSVVGIARPASVLMSSPTLQCQCGCRAIAIGLTNNGFRMRCTACSLMSKNADTEAQARQFWNAMVVRLKDENRDA